MVTLTDCKADHISSTAHAHMPYEGVSLANQNTCSCKLGAFDRKLEEKLLHVLCIILIDIEKTR